MARRSESNKTFFSPFTLAVLFTLLALIVFPRLYGYAATSLAAGRLAGRVVFLDPGHGGPDPGTVGGRGTLEKDVVLDIALILQEHLTAAGATVYLTRNNDIDLSGMEGGSLSERKRRDMQARVDLINQSDADILVSIHANSIGSPRWAGGQTFYHPASPPASKILAETIQRELIDITGETDRVVSNHIQHKLLTDTDLPAVTVEVGFLSNPREEQLLASGPYRQKVAWALFIGIARYFAQKGQPPLLPATVEPIPLLPASGYVRPRL